MAYPTPKIEIAFTNNWYDTAPTWVDVTNDVRSFSTSRGRTADLQPFDAGTAQLVLDNRARKYDPLNTAGPYYGNLKPRRQVRITADAGAGYVNIFRGFTGGFPTTWTDAGYDSTVTVECFDLLGLISDQRLPNDWSSYGLPGFKFLMDDPETVNTISSSFPGWVATQTAGGVPFRKTESLALGVDRQAISFGTGVTYQTPALNYGDVTPPTNNLGNISVGFWWSPDYPSTASSPVTIFAGAYTIQFNVLANNKLNIGVITNGTQWNCDSTNAPLSGFNSHHLAATWQPLTNTIKVYIDGKDVTGTQNTFGGGSSTPTTIIARFQNDNIQDLFINRPNNTSVMSAAEINQVYQYGIGQFAESTTARMTRYLDAVTSPNTAVPSAFRNLTTEPVATVAGLENGVPVLDGLQTTADSEGGELYANKAGQLTFLSRNAAISAASGTAAATFNDNGTALSYGQTLDITIDDRNIRNDVTITFTDGGQVRYTNNDSITANGTVAQSISTTLSSVAEANSLGSFRRDIDATAVPQFSAIDASSNTSNAAWQTLLGLELITSKIVVNRTPSTGPAISQSMVVLQIEHNVVPGRWETRIVGTRRFSGWFVLDQSVLDGSDVLLT